MFFLLSETDLKPVMNGGCSVGSIDVGIGIAPYLNYLGSTM